MTDSHDKELVARFQEGDESAFNDLVKKHQQKVYQIARRMLNTHEEAQDLSQDIFIKVYDNLKSFRQDAGFATWIYRIAVNMSINAWRRVRLRQFFSLGSVGFSLQDKSISADLKLEKDEQLEMIKSAIAELPPQQKMVFHLRYFQNLPHEEIARILARDVGTVKANYHHAIRKLLKAVNI